MSTNSLLSFLVERGKNEFCLRVCILFSRGRTRSGYVREGRTRRRVCAFSDISPNNDGESVNEFIILSPLISKRSRRKEIEYMRLS